MRILVLRHRAAVTRPVTPDSSNPLAPVAATMDSLPIRLWIAVLSITSGTVEPIATWGGRDGQGTAGPQSGQGGGDLGAFLIGPRGEKRREMNKENPVGPP